MPEYDIRSENRWQVTSWPARPHTDFAEINFGFPAGQVRLRNEHPGHPTTAFDADLWPPCGHVGPHHRVGHIVHAVLGAQPVENPGDGVALLAWRVEVGAQDLNDHGFERIEFRHLGRVGGALRRPRRRYRRLHRAPPDTMFALNLATGHTSAGVAANRRVQLNSGVPRHQRRRNWTSQ